MIELGCTLPTSGANADPGVLRAVAQAAEGLGYDSVWVSDHVVIPEKIASTYPYSVSGEFHLAPTSPYLEPLTALSFLAGVTARVRLGTHVLILPYRHPVLAGKVLATLDYLSGGRLDLGIGVGWMAEEFAALGSPPFDRRGGVTDEQVAVFKTLWSDESSVHAGEFYQFDRLGSFPKPVQRPHPPIWVGGHTLPAIRRAARLGDGWLPIGARPPANLPPAEMADLLAVLRAEAVRLGRDASALRVRFSAGINLREKPAGADRAPFSGTPDQVAADFTAYRALGIDEFLIGAGPGTADQIEARLRRVMEQVVPAIGSR